MRLGRLMIERRKDLASASKWKVQAQAFLRDELGDHSYTKRFEEALSQPGAEGVKVAYGILWAAYEDALKGDLKPASRERRNSSAWPQPVMAIRAIPFPRKLLSDATARRVAVSP